MKTKKKPELLPGSRPPVPQAESALEVEDPPPWAATQATGSTISHGFSRERSLGR
jgi:hypothetical protein